jgi:hypothetical protein
MNVLDATSDFGWATKWLFDFFVGWTIIAAAGAYRLLFLPAAVVYGGGGEDFTTELGLASSEPQEDRSRENLGNAFKIWLATIVAADLFFALSCGRALVIVFKNDLLLGIVLALLQVVLVLSVLVLCISTFTDSVSDYTIEGDRSAIDRRWKREAAQVKLGIYGTYFWLFGMFVTTVWLFVLHRGLT